MKVWRELDAEALDEQLSLDSVQDREALFARRLDLSRRARERFRPVTLRYGEGAAETLDVYAALPSARPAPVQVFIHGGYWRSLDATTFSFLADAFVPQGATLVVVDYPLMPEVDLASIVDACERAIGWIWRHAADHGGDSARIYISGNSAGGHLVALLADRAWPGRHELPADVVAGGCAISGLYELEPVFRSSQNDTIRLTEREVAELSPLRRLPTAAAPLILAVGGAETDEFHRQTRDYADAWRAAGLVCEQLVVPGANHIDVVLDHLGRPGSLLHAAVARQMGLA